MSSVKAVIFDCFGVISLGQFMDFCHRYFEHGSTEIEKAFDILGAVEAGKTNHQAAYQQLSQLAGVTVDEVKSQLDFHQPWINLQLLGFIRQHLKPDYKIGMLSNVEHDWPKENLTPEQNALFDEQILSFRFGRAKPDPEIYEYAANRLGVLPEECLFVDDILPYCQAAERVGMKSIHFVSTEQAISDIKQQITA